MKFYQVDCFCRVITTEVHFGNARCVPQDFFYATKQRDLLKQKVEIFKRKKLSQAVTLTEISSCCSFDPEDFFHASVLATKSKFCQHKTHKL